MFDNLGLPIGALTLACTAVDYAFRHYYTGVEAAPKGLRRFDYDAVGHLMEDWYVSTVQPLAETKPHRFQALIARAREWGRAVSNDSEYLPESTRPERRRPVMDRDSSPALPE
ncbi:hypothetical protein BD311DRAFT_741275 [Dichomitus squalens]|uniref:Uncharacterized protein n=1 Tax=Dichomitus squalens TaxID=114155 RepID=A0A4Q9MH75_9APHY|nr:hypothetical protein BD311DRAFT_741275 [Dichomitus squalens]